MRRTRSPQQGYSGGREESPPAPPEQKDGVSRACWEVARCHTVNPEPFAPLQSPAMEDRRDRSRSPGNNRQGNPVPNPEPNAARAAAVAAAGAGPGDSVKDVNVVSVCSETFCFKHVKGVLLQEVKAAYKKHADRMQSVQGGVSNFETLQQDVKEFQRCGQVPKWCKAKEVLPLKHRLLQEAGSDLQVAPPDGQTKPARQELLREFPWLEHVWANHRLPENAPTKDLFETATKEWEKLQLFGRYYVAAKQQETSREAFTPGALKRDLDEHLTKLLQAVSELTGETVDSLRPKYRLEQEELHAFAELVQKTLATRAAAERMRHTQQTAKLEAKQQQAKEKVQAMDLNQVVAASVTQSLLQVLPTCGVRVPKRLQETLAAAATKPLATEDVKQGVLDNLLGKPAPKAAAKPKPKPKAKPKSQPRAQPKATASKGGNKSKGKGKGKANTKSKQAHKGGKGKGQQQKGKGKGGNPGPIGRRKGWRSSN